MSLTTTTHTLLVLGASGCGKSALVNRVAADALDGGALPAARRDAPERVCHVALELEGLSGKRAPSSSASRVALRLVDARGERDVVRAHWQRW